MSDTIRISPGIAKGTFIAPPSKSYAHRLLIASFLSNSKTTISNVDFSNDIKATLDCIRELGCKFNIEKNNVHFLGNNDTFLRDEYILDCQESGSTIRFIIPIALAMKKNCKITMKGTQKLIQRGLSVYEDIFSKNNIQYTKGDDYFSFCGELKNNNLKVPGDISSQYITGLIFASTLMPFDVNIEITGTIESLPYINITIDVLRKYGINIDFNGDKIFIKSNQKFLSSNLEVEGDFSNSAFFEALNYISSANAIKVQGLNESSMQGDKVYREIFEKLNDVKKSSIDNEITIDISNCIDLGPIVFVMASFLNGAKITGIKRLRIKESDRALCMQAELKKFGADIELLEDSAIIRKAQLHTPREILDGHNDHRIVMSLSVLMTKYGGVLRGYGAVSKSFPNFFEKIEDLGIKYEFC